MVLPPESNQELVNFLAQCCLFIFDRLMKSWTVKLAAAAQPHAPNNEETIAGEVINEALLHNLSREFSAFMKEMLFHMSHSWTGSTHVDMGNTPAPSAIFNYLLQQNVRVPTLIITQDTHALHRWPNQYWAGSSSASSSPTPPSSPMRSRFVARCCRCCSGRPTSCCKGYRCNSTKGA